MLMKTICFAFLAVCLSLCAQTPQSAPQPVSAPVKPVPAQPARSTPARRVIINSQADVPAQTATSLSIDLDAESATALLAAATSEGKPDVASYVSALVQKAVQDAELRYPPADIYAAQITLLQRFRQHLTERTQNVKTVMPVTPPVKQ